jgi:hypothetical protein
MGSKGGERRDADRAPAPERDAQGSAGLDPVAALALLCGVAGIFLLQLVMVPVTMVLAAVAGNRARGGHGDIGYAYTAFAIGAVDGILVVVSLVLHGTAPTPLPH